MVRWAVSLLLVVNLYSSAVKFYKLTVFPMNGVQLTIMELLDTVHIRMSDVIFPTVHGCHHLPKLKGHRSASH